MSGPTPKPAAEVAITAELVRRLLEAQHPDLAGLPLRELASGWDNVLFRAGDDLVVRLPRRPLAAELVRAEQRWLPVLAPHLPLPIPVPLRIGQPTDAYPWWWSVVAYQPGRSAAHEAPDDPAAAAEALGGFVAALHQPAPPDAPANEHRGVPLADRSERNEQWLHQLAGEVDAERLRRCWDDLVATPPWEGPPLWLHGDLHPDNLVVHHGRLRAVIDFGDITSGDPATDLVSAWMWLPADHRHRMRVAAEVDDHTWRRGMGWALTLGLAYLAHSADQPAYAVVGRRTLDAVATDMHPFR